MNLVEMLNNDELKKHSVDIECDINKKIKLLNLSEKRVAELKEMKYKYCCLNLNDCGNTKIEFIKLENLVGSCRPNMRHTWYGNLEDLHKMVNFERFLNKENFEIYLKNMSEEDLPDVIEFQDEYYINGNGRHRLTIAKCVGVERIKAVVISVKSQIDKE